VGRAGPGPASARTRRAERRPGRPGDPGTDRRPRRPSCRHPPEPFGSGPRNPRDRPGRGL